MDNQLTNSSVGTVGAKLEQAPSIVMSELERVEQLVFSLYSKLDKVITPVPSSNETQASGHLLSDRLRLISATLEHILTNIEL